MDKIGWIGIVVTFVVVVAGVIAATWLGKKFGTSSGV